jgi:hypothetical protein
VIYQIPFIFEDGHAGLIVVDPSVYNITPQGIPFVDENGNTVHIKVTTSSNELIAAIKNDIYLVLYQFTQLTSARQTGIGGLLWTDFWRIFLSKREEKSDYNFKALSDAVDANLFGEYDSSKLSDPVTILDFEKALLSIHKMRGTESGITADTRRICNSPNVALNYYGQDSCGWIADITSPDLTPDLQYDPENSLCFLDLDNMVVINAINKSSRSKVEIASIIRHDFVPLKYNLKTNLFNIDQEFGLGLGQVGIVPAGGTP